MGPEVQRLEGVTWIPSTEIFMFTAMTRGVGLWRFLATPSWLGRQTCASQIFKVGLDLVWALFPHRLKNMTSADPGRWSPDGPGIIAVQTNTLDIDPPVKVHVNRARPRSRPTVFKGSGLSGTNWFHIWSDCNRRTCRVKTLKNLHRRHAHAVDSRTSSSRP